MKELSLYVLDIAMNSVKAGASKIEITLIEESYVLTFTVKDNGCGMTEEQVQKISDPFFTTRTTREVGLGVPFLIMLAEQTGGGVTIESKSEKEYEDHGTLIRATFGMNNFDFIPMGDIISTLVTLIQGSPDIDFVFTHSNESGIVTFKTSEVREVLGDVPLSEPEVLAWIRGYLEQQYEQI